MTDRGHASTYDGGMSEQSDYQRRAPADEPRADLDRGVDEPVGQYETHPGGEKVLIVLIAVILLTVVLTILFIVAAESSFNDGQTPDADDVPAEATPSIPTSPPQ